VKLASTDSARLPLEEDGVTGSEVRSYARLRENLAKRDRSLREKVMSLHDAATLVRDGMSVGIGGSTMSRTPMAMIWELMRQRRKHLSCSRSIVSTDGDLLFGSDLADEVVTSWFAQGILWGLSKVMRHHVEKGGKRFQEWSHMAMGMRFRAGGMGVPFLPIRSMLGSDVLKQRPEPKEFDCPFTGEKLLLVPALNPDVRQRPDRRAAVHGHRSRHGGRSGDSDDRADHFQRSDQARARSNQDSLFLRGCGG
jgi:glutaconate CoA-transferase, subunit A